MARVEVRVIDGDPVKIGDTVIALGENRAVDISYGDSIERADPPDPNAGLTGGAGMDVFDPGNRPNGVMTAQIAPKLPKSGGELEQVQLEEGNVYAERQVAPRGEAEQGGGKDMDGAFKTPGPQPDNNATGDRTAASQTAAATGDVKDGKPVARTDENVQTGAKTAPAKK